jgi:hypothetical protein
VQLVRVPGQGNTHQAVASEALQITPTECGRFVRIATPTATVFVPWSNIADLHVTELQFVPQPETTAKPKRGSK